MRAIELMVFFEARFGCGFHGNSPMRHAILAVYDCKMVNVGDNGTTVWQKGAATLGTAPRRRILRIGEKSLGSEVEVRKSCGSGYKAPDHQPRN